MSDARDAPRAVPQLQFSPLLVGSLIAASLSTIAMAIFAVAASGRPTAPPGWPANMPPPPPNWTPLVVSVGVCVIAWVAVLTAIQRDQLLRNSAMLREILAAIEDYGDRRDTEGYLRALRKAGLPAEAEVRPLHRVPPPAPPTP